MHRNKVYFRVDGDKFIGLGHIYRCASLYEILCDSFSCSFLISQSTADAKYAIFNKYKTIVIENAKRDQNEISFLSSILSPNDVFVHDGYNYDIQYLVSLKKLLIKLVLIEDNVQENVYADLVINHGENRDLPFKIDDYIYLKGIEYLIVAPLFLRQARERRLISELNTVFICMGGADPFNLTNKLLQACCDVEWFNKIIVVKGAAASENILLSNIEKENTKLEIYSDIDHTKMAELICSSHLALVTSSSIALELSCLKIGILTGYMVDNQECIYNTLISTGCALGVGNWFDCSKTDIVKYLKKYSVELINKQMLNQHRIIDGNSGERILNCFKKISN
jgi:UDP-2,4-diacetamido-2,4,6-trideoxy-beta-L-altropyranose hydrolase